MFSKSLQSNGKCTQTLLFQVWSVDVLVCEQIRMKSKRKCLEIFMVIQHWCDIFIVFYKIVGMGRKCWSFTTEHWKAWVSPSLSDQWLPMMCNSIKTQVSLVLPQLAFTQSFAHAWTRLVFVPEPTPPSGISRWTLHWAPADPSDWDPSTLQGEVLSLMFSAPHNLLFLHICWAKRPSVPRHWFLSLGISWTLRLGWGRGGEMLISPGSPVATHAHK